VASIVLNERVRSVSSSMPRSSMGVRSSVSVTRINASVSFSIGSMPERAITQPIAPASRTASRPKVSRENANSRRIASVGPSGRPRTRAYLLTPSDNGTATIR